MLQVIRSNPIRNGSTNWIIFQTKKFMLEYFNSVYILYVFDLVFEVIAVSLVIKIELGCIGAHCRWDI